MNHIPTTDNSSRGNASISNFKIGLRTALFLRFSREKLYVSWSQVVLFTAIHLILLFALDFAHLGFNGEFNWYGLPGAIFNLPLMIVMAWAMALSANKPEKTLSLLVVFCLLSVPYEVSFQLLNWILSRQFIRGLIDQRALHISTAANVWLALAYGLVAIRLLDIADRRKIIILLLPILLICGIFSQVMQYRTLWIEPYDPEISRNSYEQHHILESENVFYLQPKLLEQELAAVVPSNQKSPVLFFVGVAGYSDQDVFMKEVHYVEELFKKRFGTSGHSITLINNSKTATTSPIASTTSLLRSLKKISEAMDQNKDILFLYMTSHGSKDHKFSLDFGSMQLNDLNPERLRDMLNESGIKRRVIVISACYSGGFIDTLKDSNTLIITSAAADKTSFGCSNDADFTYFGKAYFDDALQKTHSFVDAFNLAKPIITARENEDDYTPSDPSIFVGDNIKIALAEFSHQLLTKRVDQSVLSYQQAKTTTSNKEINQDNPIKIPSALIKSQTEEKEKTRIQQANQLIVLMKYRNLIEDSIVQCKQGAKSRTPNSIVKEQQNYFRGITPQSKLWPEVVSAYEDYFNESCEYTSNDYLLTMNRVYSSSLTAAELSNIIKFYSSPVGEKFVIANLTASTALQKELSRQMSAKSETADTRFKQKIAALGEIEARSKTKDQMRLKSWWKFW